MGLFSRKKEKRQVDTYNHFSKTVPEEWIEKDGKQYFRKYYYTNIEIEKPTHDYMFFKDCDRLLPRVSGDKVELYFFDVHAGDLPERFAQMLKDFNGPVEIQACCPSGGRIVCIRLAFYVEKEKLALQSHEYIYEVTNDNEDDVLKIDDLTGRERVELTYDDEEECFFVYAEGPALLGKLSKLKSKRLLAELNEGYQGDTQLLDVKIKKKKKAISKIKVIMK